MTIHEQNYKTELRIKKKFPNISAHFEGNWLTLFKDNQRLTFTKKGHYYYCHIVELLLLDTNKYIKAKDIFAYNILGYPGFAFTIQEISFFSKELDKLNP